ncbi:hypothetical protein [Burkholderia multivorans]|uniref:hypothetical protein n=1 Tax=Burkholderia multivorans TaxID=87883 RepID=UPI0021BC0A13|nr:hypothetical protein [Burkholderia multivorans]
MPNFGSVSLGGPAATPVKLTNIADGESRYDAVNFGQFNALLNQIGDMGDRVVKLEAGGGALIGGSTGDGEELIPADPGTGSGGVSIGSGSAIRDAVDNGTSIGTGASVGGNGGTALGSGAVVDAEGGTAIGQGSRVSANADNLVAIGQGSIATEQNTVSFGTMGGERRIVNVADGGKRNGRSHQRPAGSSSGWSARANR